MKKERVPRYFVGTKFKSAGKHPQECTVTDIFTTRNLANELVEFRYQTIHEFAGQIITEIVPEATIARGIIR